VPVGGATLDKGPPTTAHQRSAIGDGRVGYVAQRGNSGEGPSGSMGDTRRRGSLPIMRPVGSQAHPLGPPYLCSQSPLI
jgi:hypothetical protein